MFNNRSIGYRNSMTWIITVRGKLMGLRHRSGSSEIQEEEVLKKVVGGQWKIPFTYLLI